MAAAKGGSKDDKKRPIIIKKVKKVAGGHHGGAWKVAYADFVTAMMAFFLLLWLLSSASKDTLQGLSEYFTPTQGITSESGLTSTGGDNASLAGKKKSTMSDRTIIAGNPISGTVSENPENKAKDDSNQDDNLFKQGASAVEQAFSADPSVSQYHENISVEQTTEGLRITIADSDKYEMFKRSSAELTEHGQKVLAKMAELVKKMPNFMAIYGNTDASPAETGNANYTNWELSADRAQSARRFLTRSGVEQERTKKVTGLADKELYLPKEPRSPKNRRISLVMLRGSHILIPDSAVPEHSMGLTPALPGNDEPAPAAAPAAPAASSGH